MKQTTIEVDLAGESLQLLPDRAVYWPARRTLFIADLHLGKPAAFRSLGVPVPEASTTADLSRLDVLLEETAATSLIILGDLFHARRGCVDAPMSAFAAWRGCRTALTITLIRGNHDRAAGDPPPGWNIECRVGPEPLGPFMLQHEPAPSATDEPGYILAGHLHPAIRLYGPASQSLRAPCFWFGPRIGVLPAFGSFTGSKVVHPARGDRVFALGEGHIAEVQFAAWCSRGL